VLFTRDIHVIRIRSLLRLLHGCVGSLEQSVTVRDGIGQRLSVTGRPSPSGTFGLDCEPDCADPDEIDVLGSLDFAVIEDGEDALDG
jgi:hypothetical protein